MKTFLNFIDGNFETFMFLFMFIVLAVHFLVSAFGAETDFQKEADYLISFFMFCGSIVLVFVAVCNYKEFKRETK